MLYNKEFEKKVIMAAKEIIEGMKEFSKKSPSIRLYNEQVELIETKYPQIVETAKSFAYSKESLTGMCMSSIDALVQEVDMETLRKIPFVKDLLPEELPTEDIPETIHAFLEGVFDTVPDKHLEGLMDYETIRNYIITEVTKIAISEDIAFSAAVDSAISIVTSEGYIEKMLYQQMKDICGYFINPVITFTQENQEEIQDEFIAYSTCKEIIEKHKREFKTSFLAKKLSKVIMEGITEFLNNCENDDEEDDESEGDE